MFAAIERAGKSLQSYGQLGFRRPLLGGERQIGARCCASQTRIRLQRQVLGGAHFTATGRPPRSDMDDDDASERPRRSIGSLTKGTLIEMSSRRVRHRAFLGSVRLRDYLTAGGTIGSRPISSGSAPSIDSLHTRSPYFSISQCSDGNTIITGRVLLESRNPSPSTTDVTLPPGMTISRRNLEGPTGNPVARTNIDKGNWFGMRPGTKSEPYTPIRMNLPLSSTRISSQKITSADIDISDSFPVPASCAKAHLRSRRYVRKTDAAIGSLLEHALRLS